MDTSSRTDLPHAATVPVDSTGERHVPRTTRRFRWWMPSLAVLAVAAGLTASAAWNGRGDGWFAVGSSAWWAFTGAAHLPYLVTVVFLAAGLLERVGFYWKGRAPEPPGTLPGTCPSVCVQLPMFNEHEVAARIIESACQMSWPADRLTVQVLDDSTDPDTRALVDRTCAELRARTGVDCHVLRRDDRRGYKAGALEAGRRRTDAEFLVIFDSDFVPPKDFLRRAIPHFYSSTGEPHADLALVQTQWGHLNHDESWLTQAQSLWVDDHHTLQMSWRSAAWGFVNFTGTAGIWRASAIEAAGGWRAASLVEDCELSFRGLFAGYRTMFVKEIVAPAELPATYTAYKAQQRRWTIGWVQLQRLHLRPLLTRFRCSPLRRVHLAYHMCVSWQWPAWALWITVMPFLIYTDHWFGSLGATVAVALYLLPIVGWAVLTAALASLETKHTYREGITPATFRDRFARIVPYAVINTGMLPHQFSSFAEGAFGPMHAEFERTPKAATVTMASGALETVGATHGRAGKRYPVSIRRPYVVAEACFVVYQLAWVVLFATSGLVVCAVGAGYVAACVLHLGAHYGDHLGRAGRPVDTGPLVAELEAA